MSEFFFFPPASQKTPCRDPSNIEYSESALTNPNLFLFPQAAIEVWEESGRSIASNGSVMRTSILGVYKYQSLEEVKQNTLEICRVTHADPRYGIPSFTPHVCDVRGVIVSTSFVCVFVCYHSHNQTNRQKDLNFGM